MFEHLNDILFHKRGNSLGNVDNESDYNQYMINRWVSMYSDETANIVNATVNWMYPVLETKQQHYKFLLKVLPSYHKRYIQYIKKHKNEKQQDSEPETNIELLADTLELSTREVKYLLQQHELKHRSNNTN